MGKALQHIVEIGSMDRRINFVTDIIGKDSFGGPTVTASSLVPNIPAAIDYMRGNEKDADGKETVFDYVAFTVRYSSASTVDHTARIQYDSKSYDIERIEELGRKRYLKFYCKYVR